MTRAFKAHHIDICQQLGAHYDGVLVNFKHVFRPLSANGPYRQAFLFPQKLAPRPSTGGLSSLVEVCSLIPLYFGAGRQKLPEVSLGDRAAP